MTRQWEARCNNMSPSPGWAKQRDAAGQDRRAATGSQFSLGAAYHRVDKLSPLKITNNNTAKRGKQFNNNFAAKN